jgi:hypothetical protein
MMAGVAAEIRNHYLPNAILESYRCTNSPGDDASLGGYVLTLRRNLLSLSSRRHVPEAHIP